MKIIELTGNDVIDFLSNKQNIIGQGGFGILSIYDETTLIKLYYKDIFKTYYTLDSKILDEEIELQLDLIKTSKELNINIEDKFKKIDDLYKKLQLTSSYSLIKGIAMYRNYVIGVLIEYYKNYETLENIYFKLSLGEKNRVLKKINYLLEDLMENDIYHNDIKENNIMVNPNNLDVKLVDLDDKQVRIEDKTYVKQFPHIKRICLDTYEAMLKRLEKKYCYK